MCKHIYIFLFLAPLTYCLQNAKMRYAIFNLFSVFGLLLCVTEYQGLLTPDCIRSYYRTYVTRRVPPRNYYYFHEQHNPHDLLTDADLNSNTSHVDVNWRIVGGQIISITDAPYQVLYGRYCGGTIIDPYWVLTAAHCKNTEKYVYAGSTQRNRANMFKICAHFIHPLWNATNTHSHDYDYQLVLLETPIPVTANSRPIAIGTMDDIKTGDMVAVTGWGHLEFKKSRMQDLLRRVYVPVMDDQKCKMLPSGFFKNITSRMFCAGYLQGNKDSCQGDSGGPAISNGKLVGLVSFGVGCAAPEHPGVYSKVPVVRDWIRSVTGLPI